MRKLLVLSLFAASCQSDPSAPACDGQGTVTGKVISGPTDQLVDKDLRVRGVATHSEGLTIRRVLVDGIPATNDGFNFENWSVTLPIDLLAGMTASNNPAITIKAEAIDVCDVRSMLDAFTVQVDATPGVRVTQLAIQHSIASGLDYIPANGNVPAILTITANADAAHAVVTLAASIGTFSGATANQVTLQGDGTASATATVLFSATTSTSREVLVTGSAKGMLAQTVVRVAGPPRLTPGTATLAPGQSIPVTVTTAGVLASCQASPAAGLSIKSGGVDLMSTPVGDTNGDQQIDIVVKADPGLTAAVASTITCRDPYGQFSTGEYTAQP